MVYEFSGSGTRLYNWYSTILKYRGVRDKTNLHWDTSNLCFTLHLTWCSAAQQSSCNWTYKITLSFPLVTGKLLKEVSAILSLISTVIQTHRWLFKSHLGRKVGLFQSKCCEISSTLDRAEWVQKRSPLHWNTAAGLVLSQLQWWKKYWQNV